MGYIEKLFKKTGWISILESILFAILGAILIWKPEGTLQVISCILGIIFIAIGIYKILSYFMAKGKYNLYNHDLIYGLMAIVIGIVTMIYSSTIGSLFRIIIGIWIIYSSFIRISLSIKLKAMNIQAWIYSLIVAIIMFLCGIYVTMNAGAVIVTIGIMMIIYAIMDIIEDIVFMKNVKEIF